MTVLSISKRIDTTCSVFCHWSPPLDARCLCRLSRNTPYPPQDHIPRKSYYTPAARRRPHRFPSDPIHPAIFVLTSMKIALHGPCRFTSLSAPVQVLYFADAPRFIVRPFKFRRFQRLTSRTAPRVSPPLRRTSPLRASHHTPHPHSGVRLNIGVWKFDTADAIPLYSLILLSIRNLRGQCSLRHPSRKVIVHHSRENLLSI